MYLEVFRIPIRFRADDGGWIGEVAVDSLASVDAEISSLPRWTHSNIISIYDVWAVQVRLISAWRLRLRQVGVGTKNERHCKIERAWRRKELNLYFHGDWRKNWISWKMAKCIKSGVILVSWKNDLIENLKILNEKVRLLWMFGFKRTISALQVHIIRCLAN